MSLGDHGAGQWIAVFYAGHGGQQPLEAAARSTGFHRQKNQGRKATSPWTAKRIGRALRKRHGGAVAAAADVNVPTAVFDVYVYVAQPDGGAGTEAMNGPATWF